MASVFDEIYDNLKNNDKTNNNRRTSNPRVNTFIKNKEKNDSKPKSETNNSKENKNDFFNTLYSVALDASKANQENKKAERDAAEAVLNNVGEKVSTSYQLAKVAIAGIHAFNKVNNDNYKKLTGNDKPIVRVAKTLQNGLDTLSNNVSFTMPGTVEDDGIYVNGEFIANRGQFPELDKKDEEYINKKFIKNTGDIENRLKNDHSYLSKLLDSNNNFIDYSNETKELEEKINNQNKKRTSNPALNAHLKNNILEEDKARLEELKQLQEDQKNLQYVANYNYLKAIGTSNEDLVKYQKAVNEQNWNLVQRAGYNLGSTVGQFTGNLIKGADTLAQTAFYELGLDPDTDNFNQIIENAEYYQNLTKQNAGKAEKVIYDIYDGMSNFLYAMTLVAAGNPTPLLGNAAAAEALTGKALLLSDLSVLGSTMKHNTEKYDFTTSVENAFMHAVLNHLTESIGGESIANILTGKIGTKLLSDTLGYAIKALANQFFAEALEEGAEAALEPLIDNWTLNKNMTVEQYLNQVLSKDTLYQMIIGGLGGLAMGAGATANTVMDFNSEVNMLYNSISEINTKEEYNAAKTVSDYLENLIDKSSDDNTTLKDAIALNKAFKKKMAEFKIKNPHADAILTNDENIDLSTGEETVINAARPTLDNGLGQIEALKEVLNAQSQEDLNNISEILKEKDIKTENVDLTSLTKEQLDELEVTNKYVKSLGVDVLYSDMVDKDGKIIDGLYDNKNKRIVINPRSNEGALSTLIHELTHGTEDSEFYKDLYILTKGYYGNNYENALKDIKKRYQNYNADYEKELVASTTQKLLKSPEYVDRLVNYNKSLAYRMYEEIKHLNEQTGTVDDIEYNFMRAFYDANNQTQESVGESQLQYAVTDSNGDKYIVLDKNKFDENGNLLSLRDIFRGIVGKEYTFDDGTFFKVVKKAGDVKMFDHLIKQYPASDLNNKEELKEMNNLIAKNVDEIFKNTEFENLEEENDAETHHRNHLYVDKFEKRGVNLLNEANGNKYRLFVSIAYLKNGERIIYAKKFLHKLDNINEKKMSSVTDQRSSSNYKLSISHQNVNSQNIRKDLMAIHHLSQDEIIKSDQNINNLTQQEIDTYNKAIKSGDMETAQQIVNKAAKNAGYSSNSDYQGTSAFNGSAPSNQGWYETIDEAIEAWNNDEFEGPATLGMYKKHGIDINNLDFFLNDNRAYRNGSNFTKESITNLRDVINNDKDTITMYRSVPVGVKENSFRNGDWITPSKSYAEDNANVHSDYPGWENGYRIIEQEVPIDDIWWDGNDINEWGYDDGNNYAYKNTPNNIKSLDTVTYDENGNPIPIEQRFDESKSDIQFAINSNNLTSSHDILDPLESSLHASNKVQIDGRDGKTIEKFVKNSWAGTETGTKMLLGYLPSSFVNRVSSLTNGEIDLTGYKLCANKSDLLHIKNIHTDSGSLWSETLRKFPNSISLNENEVSHFADILLNFDIMNKPRSEWYNGEKRTKIDFITNSTDNRYEYKVVEVIVDSKNKEFVLNTMMKNKKAGSSTVNGIAPNHNVQNVPKYAASTNNISNDEEIVNNADTEMQRLAEEVSHREGIRRSLEEFTDDSGMVKNFFGVEGQAPTLNELEDSALKTIDDAKNSETKVLEDQGRKLRDTGKKDLNTLLRKVTNKGKAFWDLSRKHGDSIYALYNNFMNANRQAEYNINKKDGLEDIINKIPSELQNDFGYYMYHLMNVDAAKYNKNVFYDFDSNQSQQVANQYEKEHPEFIKVRDEIYKYEKDLRDMLIDSGRITQNTADKWESMYPHYVHVARNVEFENEGTNIKVQSSNKGTVKDRVGGTSSLKSLHDALVEQTRQVYKSVALNELAREYSKLTDKKMQFYETKLSVDGQLEEMGKEIREADEYNPATLAWYENGNTNTIEIPDDVYEALKPSEYMNNVVTRTLEKANNFRRNLITGKNPMFMVRNIFKDSQDVLYKSEHPIATYGQLLNPQTAYELATNTGLAERWHELGGGLGNFTEVHTGNKFYNNTIGLIEKANNFTESLPRYAEFKASLLKGRSEIQAMYDSDKVTTNFKMGGELTKQADRLGATFLNASVEGFTELVQTYERAYDKNGIKGIASKMALSTLVYSLPLMVLNHLMWKDDKDYEELSDYIKDNYYIVGKVGNRFIRIPKGRIAAAYQSVLNVFIKDGKVIASNNDGKTKAKELWDNTLDSIVSVWDNIGVNNPFTNNLFSPLIQVANNKTWYGDELLSEYELRKEPSQQYDYSTDELSKWVGANLNLSPKKINYLLNQYSGGIGDIVLPMLTPKAETGLDDGSIGGKIGSALASPWVDTFSTDPVFKNQNVSDLFTLDEELSKAVSKENATDEEKLSSKYITSIKYKMFDLYGERAKIYNDKSLTDAEKYSRARDIQNEINDLARLGNNTYDQVDLSGNYGEINGYGYYKDSEGSWKKVDSKTMDEMNGLSMTSSQRNSFYNLKSSINDSDKDKNTKVNEILNSNLSDEQKNYVYDKYYSSKTGDYINTLDLQGDKKVSLKNAVSTAQGVKNSKGKTISNSKALAVADAYADEGVLDDVFDYIKKNGLNPSEFGLSKTVMNYSYNQMSKAYEQVFGQAFGNGENQQLSSGYSGSSNGSKSYKKQQKAMIKFAQGLSTGNSSNVFSGLNDILSSATSIDDVKKKIKEIQKKYA